MADIKGVPFKLNAADIGGLGGFDLGQAIRSGLENANLYQETKYKPQALANKNYAEQLANQLQQYNVQYAPRNLENEALAKEIQNRINTPYAENANRAFLADIGNKEATTGLTTQNTLKQKILNDFLKQREQAEIDELKARGQYYAGGGSGGSTGSKDYQSYLNNIGLDNPNLSQNQIREAADVLAKGGNQLSDGTPLNPMSIGTKSAFDRAIKATTTAQQINLSNSANQADVELDVFSELSNKWRKPYGTTYFGKSPQQIFDSFKNDDKSQTQLGELIAANALEYEQAQIRNRLSYGQPGITSTQQLMNESQQHINTLWPRLSGKAREVVNSRLNYALRKGLEARNKLGTGAGNVYTNQYKPQKVGKPNINTEAPPNTAGLYKNGELYFIPLDKVDEALSEGFTYE